MPNKPRRDKTNVGGRRTTRLQSPTSPRSARAILEGVAGDALPALARQLQRHEDWREWLTPRLPAGLASKVAGVTERDGCLTLLAVSAPWCARLRYALPELLPAICAHAPAITQVKVRVLPRG